MGCQSKRWTEPHSGELTKETAEVCRQCGKVLRHADVCAGHERECSQVPLKELPPHKCRKCNTEVGARVNRLYHEARCRGDAELNLRCTFCDALCPTMAKRTRHEGACLQRAPTRDGAGLYWQCGCGWQQVQQGQTKKRLDQAVERHKRGCRGSEEQNLTCRKCNKKWPSITQRQSHESQCRGPGDAQRTCLCCNIVFANAHGRSKHESRMKRQNA